MNKYKTNNFPDKYYYSTKNIILRELGVGNIILDVGCNDGYFGKFDKNNIYYGLDYLKEALDEARKYYKKTLLYDLNNLQKLPWNIKFDAIIFADILEHLLNPEDALKFFTNNYLKEGGIIISLPNVANLFIRVNLLLGKFDYTDSGILDKTHLHLYTLKSAREFINKNNLKIIKEKFSSNHFGYFIKVFPFLGTLLGYNLIFVCQRKY